jgi:hypothetical protein
MNGGNLEVRRGRKIVISELRSDRKGFPACLDRLVSPSEDPEQLALVAAHLPETSMLSENLRELPGLGKDVEAAAVFADGVESTEEKQSNVDSFRNDVALGKVRQGLERPIEAGDRLVVR